MKGTIARGTCEWITHNGSYKSWMHVFSDLVSISGAPGEGKTILSVFLTEELKSEKGCKLALPLLRPSTP